MIFSIGIQDGKLSGFSKPTSDTSLAGIWKLTKDEQDCYWNLKADGKGTFHTLGASVAFEFTVTEDKKIDGVPYTISEDALTLSSEYVNVTLEKVTSVTVGSGAGGDARLHGAWKMTQGGQTTTYTFNANGTWVQEPGSYSGIWKTDGSNLSIYSPSFDPSPNVVDYTVSGSTLTINGWVVYTR
ncbi:MAG: hypothetical protein LBK25_04875 [Treponema sp.]|nr:hypothetical protein [Treponema sp.]